jgi:DNA-binding NarL/FixJ family response regulator
MADRQPVFLILEDHPEVAQNNCLFLQKIYPEAICVIAGTPREALERLKLETPDLIIVDLLFSTLSGEQTAQASSELLKQIFQEYSLLNILIYTSEYRYLQPLAHQISRHQGGFVVVSKLERRKAYLDGVQHALDGKLEIPRELRNGIELDEREVEVLHLLCHESLTDRAIAQRLNVSLKTAQNSVQRLKYKLGIDFLDEHYTSSRVALCMEAVRRKFISL